MTYGWSINFGLPEVIAFGTYLMALKVLPQALDDLPDALDGADTIRDGQRWPMTVNGHPLCGRIVDPTRSGEEWFTETRFARRNMRRSERFDALQLFWADEAGRYQWDRNCSAICHNLQPLLFEAR